MMVVRRRPANKIRVAPLSRPTYRNNRICAFASLTVRNQPKDLSGADIDGESMSALARKQTFAVHERVSAMGQKQTRCRSERMGARQLIFLQIQRLLA